MAQIDSIVLEEVRALRREVAYLTDMMVQTKKNETWLEEKTAAILLGIAPRTLRRKVKADVLQITARKNESGRGWQYSRKAVMNYQEQTRHYS